LIAFFVGGKLKESAALILSDDVRDDVAEPVRIV
jgi:hypothetical protein